MAHHRHSVSCFAFALYINVLNTINLMYSHFAALRPLFRIPSWPSCPLSPPLFLLHQACSYGRSAAGAASPGTGPGLVAYAFVDAQLEGAPPLLPPSRRYWGLLRAGARQHGLDRSYRDYLYSLPRRVFQGITELYYNVI